MKKLLAVGSFCAVLVCAQAIQIRVSNAASYQTVTALAPGAIITVFGTAIANATAAAPDPLHLPRSLGGVTLTVNGLACEIYYVSPNQITARLDPAVQTGEVEVAVTSPVAFALTRVVLEPRSSAGMFTASGTGSGDGAILNAITLSGGPFSPAGASSTGYLALFTTGLDSTIPPIVRIGGMPVPVLFFGNHPLYPGLQQINVQLSAALAGMGRVEVVVEQNGRRSNATEILLLPAQLVFPSQQPNQVRSRELAAIAWVPGTNFLLIADENDDVLRVIDVTLRRVTRVISLPDGAQPVAIGVWPNGPLAAVALRGRNSIALVDLSSFVVQDEFPAGRSPSAIAVAAGSDQAAVANADSDSVTFFDFRARAVSGTASTGRLPRGITADAQRVYVTNQSDGTVTALDWTTHSAVNTLRLGVDTRPGAIALLPGQGFAAVADPSAGPEGRVVFVNLGTGASASFLANPEKTGGASSMAVLGDTLYLVNQSGGSVTALGTSVTSTSVIPGTPSTIRVDAGPRASALNAKDNLLAVLNEGSGTVSLADLTGNAATVKIDGLRVSANDDDDHVDRLAAPNFPRVNQSLPTTAQSDSTIFLELDGSNLTGAQQILFLDPATVSGLTRGRGNLNRGKTGDTDPSITVSNLQVSPDGTQITAQVYIGRGHATSTRLIRVLGPNGETAINSSLALKINQ